ncbi:MAG: ArnT family glycosyltransferase [Thermoanaerobaculia bacterium]
MKSPETQASSLPLLRPVQSRNRSWLWLAAGATVAIRAAFIFAQKIDSDEPQHLHIAWAWTRGLVQYRDVFDNHLPLLHILFAPVIALMPESSTTFLLMRLAIAPIAIACSLMLYFFARPHFGERTAIVAALLFSVMPPWLATSVEFRNDTLWIFFWLAGLALLSRAKIHWAGVAFALSLLASIKAVPLLLAHGLALATQGQIVIPSVSRGTWRKGRHDAPVDSHPTAQVPRLTLGMTIQFAAAAAVPVFLTISWMYAAGAFDEMLYSTLFFNAAAPVAPARRISGVVGFAIVAAVMSTHRRTQMNAQTHLGYFAIWYVALLLAFWPILTPRDFLPLVPIAALMIAAKVPPRNAVVAALIVAAALASYIDERLWRPREHVREDFVDEVVRLTGPDDFVFDLKGDAVFRQRAATYVYEDVGRALTAKGKIPDRGPEDIVASQCCAAIRDSTHLPPRTRAFLNAHFVGDGLLRVCGTEVRGTSFEIAVPQTYAVVARDPARVAIDGIPYRGPRALAAGRHTLSSGGNEQVRVIWWRAAKEWL